MNKEHKARLLARRYLAQGRGVEATNRMLRAVGSDYRAAASFDLIHRYADVG